MLIVSDSNPIQFWPIVDSTFNEEDKDSQFIEDYEFFLEFGCSDPIKLKFIDTVNKDYRVAIYDEDDVFITRLTPSKVFTTPYYVYDLTFIPSSIGVCEGCFKCIIEEDTIVTTYTEVQNFIEQFASDMEGWTNISIPPTTLAALSTFANHGSGTTWALVAGKPQVFSGLSGPQSKLCVISFPTTAGYTYQIDCSFEIDTTAVHPDCTIILSLLDSGFNAVDGYVLNFSSIGSLETKTISKRFNSSITGVYLCAEFRDPYTGAASQCTWKTAVYTADAEADWAQSSDNGGCLKITTITSGDTSKMIKSGISLPSTNSFIRIKWQIDFPEFNTNLSILFEILDSSSGLLYGIVVAAPLGSSEQFTVLSIPGVTVGIPANKLSIELANGGLAGDVVRINSIESYTLSASSVDSLVPLYKSDIISATNDLGVNVLVGYKTSKNFDGIVPSTGDDYFYIRIPGRLYHAVPRGDQKIQELSNGVQLTTFAGLSKAKRFQIDDLPYYMHDKLKSILMFCVTGSLLINGVEWELNSGDAYGFTDDRPDTYPLRSAEIILTRKNYTKHNVI